MQGSEESRGSRVSGDHSLLSWATKTEWIVRDVLCSVWVERPLTQALVLLKQLAVGAQVQGERASQQLLSPSGN